MIDVMEEVEKRTFEKVISSGEKKKLSKRKMVGYTCAEEKHEIKGKIDLLYLNIRG